MMQFQEEAHDISKINRKRVCGVGVNDVWYQTSIYSNGTQIRCPYYSAWVNLLRKCYGKYGHCVVAEEWHQLTNFRFWMKQQQWENKQISMDVLSPWSKIYSPKTCVFVSPEINKLFISSKVKNGNYPRGVCFHQSKFKASCGVNGKMVHLGYYDTPEEASKVYKEFKANRIRSLAQEQTDTRIRQGLLWHADLVQYSLN